MLPLAELAGFAAAIAAVVALELTRHPEYLSRPRAIFAYTPNPETTPVALAILAAPLVWWLGGRRSVIGWHGSAVEAPELDGDREGTAAATVSTSGPADRDGRPSGRGVAWCLSAVVFALHVALLVRVGRNFDDMPPAYHDEYSYLFQAKTFLAGRLYFPTHQLAEFFDQMHVLNDNGVFASRYFPGVGLWLAPWVALGKPYWGQYLAGGLIVVLVFWIGREVGWGTMLGSPPDAAARTASHRWANLLGLLAALFCAVSPAMLLFGNLLLSHHPTTLALAAFVLCYLRAVRSERLVWPLVGGLALAFAMLCRPLTAFGFALPFGLHLGWLVWRGKLPRAPLRVGAALSPILAGLALLAGYNAALTGDPLRSPYGRYTEIYTPKHGYGFNNVTRGERHHGPKVLENYNNWAEELTPARAVRLLGLRASASSVWSVGRVSLAWLLPVLLVSWPRLGGDWKRLAAAIIGLHAVYFPYSFEGIFGLSYVFESVPVLCLLAAGVCVSCSRGWVESGRWCRPVWLAVFCLLGLLGPWHNLVKPFDPDAEGGWLEQVRGGRAYYAHFEPWLQEQGVRPPAILFIEPDPFDRSRDLITNSPTLDDALLRARNRGTANIELAKDYPDRSMWLYNARTGELDGGVSYTEFMDLLRQHREQSQRQP